MTLESRVRAELREWESAGLLRTPRAPEGIDLSSNDYLALAGHPSVTAAMAQAVEQDGCGSGGSRLLRGHRAVFDEAERAFAVLKQTDRALYFSSGYLANLAVLSALPQRGDLILSDRLNHASLRDGVRLSVAKHAVFAHTDLGALTRLLEQADGHGRTFVVTESLFSMDGDMPPLADYAECCRRAGATLVVDEAHAVGIYGRRGSGLIEASGVPANEVITINTAGKALGVAGAFVAGASWLIEYLVQRARTFVFSTAPPPAVAAAILASLALLESEPERRNRVRALAAYLRARLAAAGIAMAASSAAASNTVPGDSPIVPVLVGPSDRAVAVAAGMQARGFDVRAIRPPTVPDGTARLRLSVNVRLTEPLIDDAVAALVATLQAAPDRDRRSWHAVSS
jgi:8-amino-7-oxononanoate synthase